MTLFPDEFPPKGPGRIIPGSPESELGKLRAEVARMRTALEPFSESPYAKVSGDFDQYEICKGVTVADLKRARAALTPDRVT